VVLVFLWEGCIQNKFDAGKKIIYGHVQSEATISLSTSLKNLLFFFSVFGGTEVWTKGLMLARQALYYLGPSVSTTIFLKKHVSSFISQHIILYFAIL
jgi:hypothetical protein